MIDTDKYEGHTPAYAWRRADGSAMFMQSANNNADAELMADAPLLLAEVKQLRGLLDVIAALIRYQAPLKDQDEWLETCIKLGYVEGESKEDTRKNPFTRGD